MASPRFDDLGGVEHVPETSLVSGAIFREGETIDSYPFFHFEYPDAEASFATSECDLVSIAMHGELHLVALPARAWHRQVARRFLSRNGLQRALLVEVPTDAGVGVSGPRIKVWVGYLSSDLVPVVFPGESGEDGALHFEDETGNLLRPIARALVEIANDQFGFHSAQSQVGETANGASGLDGEPLSTSDRLATLELGLGVEVYVERLGSA